MIKPINNYILVEPIKYDSFISQGKEIYEEIGLVKEISKGVENLAINIGDKVFFDAWLAAKYPSGKGEEYFWLINYQDIRAVEKDV